MNRQHYCACSIFFFMIFEQPTLDGALLKLLSLMPLVEVPELCKLFWNSRKTSNYVSKLIFLLTLLKAKCSSPGSVASTRKFYTLNKQQQQQKKEINDSVDKEAWTLLFHLNKKHIQFIKKKLL